MKNKKIIVSIMIACLFILSISFVGCQKDTNTETIKVNLNEVVRSIFYAPMYVAINEGFFEEEGIDIELSTGQGADKTMQQVLSGAADIGFCGPEQVIYIYNQGKEDYPIIFAQLTQKDGSFLVGRNEEKDFKWESLRGKTVIGGRPGGVPEMAFEYVLRNHGIQPGEDIEIITNLAFTATSGAFKSGTGEYVTLFEPTASLMKEDKSGYIVASIGDSAGSIPYTCYFSTKSYMEANPDTIENFTRAIYKGQQWIYKHSDEEIASTVKSFFPGADEAVLVEAIKNYKSINAYAKNPIMEEENLDRLMDIIQSYNSELLPERPSFDIIVNNEFAEKIVSEFKSN